jgi:hypothetical protein
MQHSGIVLVLTDRRDRQYGGCVSAKPTGGTPYHSLSACVLFGYEKYLTNTKIYLVKKLTMINYYAIPSLKNKY